MAQPLSESTLKKLRRIGQILNLLVLVSPHWAGQATFRLFCSPRRKPLPQNDKDFLEKARQQVLEVNGKAIITYHWPATAAPNGRNVLFLHGWESHSARWRNYVKAVCKAGFSVQAFDAPASGLSGGRKLSLLIFSEAIKKYIAENGCPYAIVGHSLGGGAAVISTTMLGAPHPEKMILLGVFSETKRVIRDFGGFIGASEEVLRQVDLAIERNDGIAIEAYSVAHQVTLLSDVQGLVMHDRDDNVAPVEEGRLIAEQWAARWIETVGLGHRMQDKSVVQAIRDFLSE